MIMRNFTTCFFTIIVMLIFLQHQLVASSSPVQQKTALFRFKQSMTISTPKICFYDSYFSSYERPSHPKTMNWSMSSDHCTWEGVTCQPKTGDVIGLDLSCSQLEGAILPNSTLFQLSHLRTLNLFSNDFSLSNQFPQEFGFFAKGLTHLNLSDTRFSGRVPSGISHLYKLVSLDLSDNYDVKLEDEVFKSLLQNLTQLRVLNLEYINISSVLHRNFSNSLRVLNLRDTCLHGVLPQEVFHLSNLEVLYISCYMASYLNYLTATLPKVKWDSSATLKALVLGGINLDGGIPDSIAFLESLTSLRLHDCNLSGPVPRSIGNLGQLIYLDLSTDNLSGPISTVLFPNLTSLRYLSLSQNNFTGPFPSWVFHLRGLRSLDLRDNSLTGSLPPWLFDHPSLERLFLGNNKFTGQLYEFESSKLQFISCEGNLLHGPIPKSFSQLVNLTILNFSSNNFSGVLDIEMFLRLKYLKSLDLSHNCLSVTSTSMATLPPQLSYLGLSSCKMKKFPHFSGNAEFIEHIDLSYNQIDEKIPSWIGLMGTRDSFFYLNLSHNKLTGDLDQLPWNSIAFLDLRSNKINGSLPALICNSSSLQILDLSNNTISGVLPICRKNLTNLSVFDLRMNNIQGNIPATLSNFRDLITLNLNRNKLEGRIPSSFAEFDYLQVLDLGNNQINDTFPQCLEALPNLQVLVLKSNKFHGLINERSEIEHPFPMLRIIDLSYNEFSGPLPTMYFQNFKGMMIEDVNKGKATYMGYDLGDIASYSDSTILVIKGVETPLLKILTGFTTIDVSRNNFVGNIPEIIGKLVSLRYLNLSHNHLIGHIPSSFGKLSLLESLDLSSNQLDGEIPQELTSINTLSRLNMSYNQLGGHIPRGSQFNTFDNDSYVGNLELCGFPLSKECEHDIETQKEGEDDDYFFSGFTWKAVVIGYVCGVVPAFILGNLMFLAGKPKWFARIFAMEFGLKVRRMEIKLR